MSAIVVVFFFMGFVVAIAGGVMFTIAAFRQSVVWGLCVLFGVPFASLLFLIKHWDEAKQAFGVQLLGVVLVFGYSASVGSGFTSMGKGLEQMALPVPEKIAETGGTPPDLGKLIRDVTKDWKMPEVNPGSDRVEGSFVGHSLEEVKRVLGEPRGVLRSVGKTSYFYPNLEVVSYDGVTVVEQGVPAEEGF